MKEFYAIRPDEVEVYHHSGVTDVILRRDIHQVDDPENGARWECQEAQCQHKGVLVLEDVARAFDHWWGVATARATNELDKVKQEKLAELSSVCNAIITAGVDVEFDDGIHHFSMKQEDQINLLSLQSLLAAGAETVPYHADGEPCRPFTAKEFAAVVEEATAVKIYHESYYNSLRSYVEALPNVYSVLGVKYGTTIPAEYHSEVFRRLLNGENFAEPPIKEEDVPSELASEAEDVAEDPSEDVSDIPDSADDFPEDEEPEEELSPEADLEPDTQDQDLEAQDFDVPDSDSYIDPDAQELDAGSDEPDDSSIEQEGEEDSSTVSDSQMEDEDTESYMTEDGEYADEADDKASDPVPDWSGDLL